MNRHTTANKHVDIFPELAKASLNFLVSELLGCGSETSRFPISTTVRNHSVLAIKNSLKFRIHVTKNPAPNKA